MMDDPEKALTNVMALHAMGFKLCIDDFGTGYSSLAYLKRLPVGELKIDRSFVKNMAIDPDDAAIVRCTIDLGHTLGLRLVAEGVEDKQSYDLLRELGCDFAQGYFFSKALSAAQTEKWLKDSPWGLPDDVRHDVSEGYESAAPQESGSIRGATRAFKMTR
jgi:diguanylate cyclase